MARANVDSVPDNFNSWRRIDTIEHFDSNAVGQARFHNPSLEFLLASSRLCGIREIYEQ